MKERPILFSSPMVRAILGGTKTMTRRVVTPQPEHAQLHRWRGRTIRDAEHRSWCWKGHDLGDDLWDFPNGEARTALAALSPYGVPGDRLFVKEACWIWGRWTLNGLTANGRQRWRFRADAEHRVRFDRPEQVARRASSQPGFDGLPGWVYRHARFMPRWASRITLDVVSVRVERVQDITESDARAEGARPSVGEPAVYESLLGPGTWNESARGWFAELWNSINAARGFGWHANPWVWVVEFKRIEAAPRREGG